MCVCVCVCVLTENYSQPESRELFNLVGTFRTPSPGDGISVALRKLLQGCRRGSQAVYKSAQKGAGHLNSKDRLPSEAI